jgi:hypothetical protein
MASWGIYELYRKEALGLPISGREAETVVVEAPDPRLRRQQAILAERQRFADIVAVRLPTAEEIATHTAAIDQIISGRP